MLEANADPNPSIAYGEPPLSRALKFATIESVRALLQAGAFTDLIEESTIQALQTKRYGLQSEYNVYQYREAAEKLVLLEQYGVAVHEYDELESMSYEDVLCDIENEYLELWNQLILNGA